VRPVPCSRQGQPGNAAARPNYGAQEFLAVEDYPHLLRWQKAIAARPAVARGRVVNRINGKPGECLRERHSAADLDAFGLAR
jgi:GST-like protein